MTDKLPDWMQEEEEGHKLSRENAESEMEHTEGSGQPAPGGEQVQPTGDELDSLLGELDQLDEFFPSESGAEDIYKPTLLGAALQITDSDRQRAKILQGLIAPEGMTSRFPAKEKHVPQRPLRILISVVIICLALIPQVFPRILVSFSAPDITSEVLSVYRIIERLPPDTPVLVAVEVEPALAGEMNMAAVPVINHLMDKKAILALVSTLPTGPAQAESLMSLSGSARNQPTAEPNAYFNFGYIPGGQAGLQNFVQSPQTIIRSPLVDRTLPESEKIRQIDSMADFALLVVVSDRPEAARYWVEQVSPFLGNTFFVVVLSAQAGPALQPYIESVPQQIQGAVIGLAGGMAYERLINQPVIPFANWASFNLALIAAVILLAGGGILNAFQTQGSVKPPKHPSAPGSETSAKQDARV
jgi:hypothetical protein